VRATLWVLLVSRRSNYRGIAESKSKVNEVNMEQRHRPRYRLTAGVNFSWNSPEGTTHTSEGCTRDISIAGVFVQTRQVLLAGTLVRMEVCFPPLNPAARRVRVRIQGRVVRAEVGGFAVAVQMGSRLRLQEDPGAARHDEKDGKQNDEDEIKPPLQLARLAVAVLFLSLSYCI